MKKISSRKNLRLILSFIRFGELYSFVFQAILEAILNNAPTILISVPRTMVSYHDRDNIYRMVPRLIGRCTVLFFEYYPAEIVHGQDCLFARHHLRMESQVYFVVRLK